MAKNPLKQLEGFRDRFRETFEGIQKQCDARHAACQEQFEGVAILADIVEEHEEKIRELEERIKENDGREFLRKILGDLSQEQVKEKALNEALIDHLMKKPEENEKLDLELIDEVMKKEDDSFRKKETIEDRVGILELQVKELTKTGMIQDQAIGAIVDFQNDIDGYKADMKSSLETLEKQFENQDKAICLLEDVFQRLEKRIEELEILTRKEDKL